MVQRLILHIGASKTGSSAIQDFLRLNWRTLRAAGYRIPDAELGLTDRITGEHVAASQAMFNTSNRAGLESRLNALLKDSHSNAIISAENLSNGANFKFFSNVLSGVDCKVVFYVRRQDEFLTSAWQQWYSKTDANLDAWLILAVQQFGHWLRCIDGWESVVGAGNVVVRIFQAKDLVNGDAVDDFVSLLGLPEPMPAFARSEGPVNPSYSDVITSVVAGSKTIFSSAHDNDFYKLVGELTGDRYIKQKKVSLISPQQREKIVEYYKPQNDALCRRYFPARRHLFDPIDHGKYDYLTLTPDELLRRQLEFLASMIYATNRTRR